MSDDVCTCGCQDEHEHDAIAMMDELGSIGRLPESVRMMNEQAARYWRETPPEPILAGMVLRDLERMKKALEERP